MSIKALALKDILLNRLSRNCQTKELGNMATNGNCTIPGVITHQQHEDKVYTFVLSAEQVVALCKVEHFGVDPNGVNRKFNEPHAIKIAEAMADHSLMWLEPILGDLTGGWKFDSKNNTLRYSPGAYISVDDGQHRRSALELLNPLERQHLSFNVTVTMGLPFERRLKIFRMQNYRRHIDARLDLAQRHRLGDWKTDTDREAYELVLKLNSDTTSPLRGMILLDEQESRPYEGRHRPIGINAKGLHSTIRSVIGGNSPLHVLSPEARSNVILSLVRLAADVWPREWKSDQYILTTARGINAILMLIVSSPNFRGAVGENFGQESLRRGLEYARTFKWNVGAQKNAGVRQIVDRLDQSIARNNKAIAA